MTIEGAKQRLKEDRAKKAIVRDGRQLLDSLRKDLGEILKLLG
jgi:hypothetical protein